MIDHTTFDVNRKAEYFTQAIADDPTCADATFVGLVYNVADTTPALAGESIEELQALVDVYKVYKAEHMAEAIAEAERLLATMNRRGESE